MANYIESMYIEYVDDNGQYHIEYIDGEFYERLL